MLHAIGRNIGWRPLSRRGGSFIRHNRNLIRGHLAYLSSYRTNVNGRNPHGLLSLTGA